MAAQKNALGRGLGALIEASEDDTHELIAAAAANEIPVENIEVNPYQPRTHFDEETLDELVTSIKELGIIQPLTVRKVGKDKYQLITGERRLRAAAKAGLKKVPAYIRDAEDKNMLELALVENIQRDDLDAIEVALSYQRLIDEVNLTQETLGERVGKKRATVTNYLRLLKLPADIQAGIKDRKLSMGQAKALITIEDPDLQLEVYQQVIGQDLSVRQVETLVQKLKRKQDGKEREPEERNDEYDRLRDHLSKFFDAKIDFKRNNKGSGKIVIPFGSDEDLQRILSILDKPDA